MVEIQKENVETHPKQLDLQTVHGEDSYLQNHQFRKLCQKWHCGGGGVSINCQSRGMLKVAEKLLRLETRYFRWAKASKVYFAGIKPLYQTGRF